MQASGDPADLWITKEQRLEAPLHNLLGVISRKGHIGYVVPHGICAAKRSGLWSPWSKARELANLKYVQVHIIVS